MLAVTELALSRSDSDLLQVGVKYGTLLEIVITFYLVWVPECGTQTRYDLFFSCFSKHEAMKECTCIDNDLVGVALQ